MKHIIKKQRELLDKNTAQADNDKAKYCARMNSQQEVIDSLRIELSKANQEIDRLKEQSETDTSSITSAASVRRRTGSQRAAGALKAMPFRRGIHTPSAWALWGRNNNETGPSDYIV